jgi:hypothetical protein
MVAILFSLRMAKWQLSCLHCECQNGRHLVFTPHGKMAAILFTLRMPKWSPSCFHSAWQNGSHLFYNINFAFDFDAKQGMSQLHFLNLC